MAITSNPHFVLFFRENPSLLEHNGSEATDKRTQREGPREWWGHVTDVVITWHRR